MHWCILNSDHHGVIVCEHSPVKNKTNSNYTSLCASYDSLTATSWRTSDERELETTNTVLL